MNMFRLLLAVIFIAIGVYTVPVLLSEGLTLFGVFFGDIAKFGWSGQFNLDFLGMLILSAFWTAWRNDFSPSGMALAILALLFGAPFLTMYLLYLSFSTNGNPKRMLIGNRD